MASLWESKSKEVSSGSRDIPSCFLQKSFVLESRKRERERQRERGDRGVFIPEWVGWISTVSLSLVPSFTSQWPPHDPCCPRLQDFRQQDFMEQACKIARPPRKKARVAVPPRLSGCAGTNSRSRCGEKANGHGGHGSVRNMISALALWRFRIFWRKNGLVVNSYGGS